MALMIVLLLQFGLVSTFQQCPAYSSSSINRPAFQSPMVCLWSASIDEKPTDEKPAAHDWDEQFEELLSFKDEYGHCNFPQSPPIELGQKYPKLATFCRDQRRGMSQRRNSRRIANNKRMSLATFDQNVRLRRLEEIGFRFNSLSAKWYEKYHELVQHRNDNGHVRVKETENSPLYFWILTQRNRRRGNKGCAKLSDAQIQLLDDIGFEWESELYDVIWRERCNELVAFRNEHGHLKVLRASNPSLYSWIYNQRKKHDHMSETQLKLLNDVGFNWNPDDAENKWHAKYKEVKKFRIKYGHLWIPQGNNLSHWISHQRRTDLSDEQIKLLNDIDFPWIPDRYDALWLDKYNDLVLFQKTHGHCQPSRSMHPRRYSWANDQRNKREKDLLTAEQIQLLDQIGFSWDGKRTKWSSMLNQLADYCNQHGHLQVSENEDPDLYEWMTMQRKRYHGIIQKPAFTPSQIEMLEEVHFCWSLDWKERTWHEKYTEAVEFYKEHGHVRILEKDNPSLYNWIVTQEKRYKELDDQKPLLEEESELLEQIDFGFLENKPPAAWDAMFAELEKYRDGNEGSFPDHKDDPKLNRWMRKQRKRLRSSYGYVALSEEQKAKLKSIDFPMKSKGKNLLAWYSKYDELVQFWKHNGHFLIDRAEDPSLSNWMTKQRMRYKREAIRSEPLFKSQIYLMERIDFPWVSNRDEVEWQATYDELIQFLDAEGRFPESLSDHPKLYKWILNQRSRYKGKGSSDLGDHQVEMLEKVGFRWSRRE